MSLGWYEFSVVALGACDIPTRAVIRLKLLCRTRFRRLWPLSTLTRTRSRTIPKRIREAVVLEGGWTCPICEAGITLDLHHVVYFSVGGENTSSNLIALCPTHHRQHHLGYVGVTILQALKRLQARLNRPDIDRDDDLQRSKWLRSLREGRKSIVRAWFVTQNETFTRDPYKYDPTSDPLSIAAVALENVPGDFLTPAEQIELILGIGHYLNRHRLGGMKGISISPDALFFAQRAEGLATNHRLEELRIRAGLARSMFLYCAEKFEAAGRAASRFVKSADDLAALGASAYDFALYLGLGGQHKRAKELWQLSSTFVTENSIYGDPSWIYHTGFLIGFSSGDRKFTEYCLDRFSGEADRTHPLMKVAALRDEAMWRASVAHRVAAVEEFSQAEAIATDLGLEHQAWVARRMGQLVAKLPKQSLSLEWLNHYSALKGGEPKSSHQGNGEVEPAP